MIRQESVAEAACEMQHRLFFLSTLHDAARELIRHDDPQTILDFFLLTAMGALGATRGFILLSSPGGQAAFMAARGLDTREEESLRNDIPKMHERFFSGLNKPDKAPFNPPGPRFIASGMVRGASFFPRDTAMAVRFILEGGSAGILGLCSTLTQHPPGRAREDFLLNLSGNVINALDKALAQAEIDKLNRELTDRNQRLEQSLGQTQTARGKLDKRLFELNMLNDAISELSGLTDPGELLKRFVLLIMGGAGATGGYLILFDASGEGESKRSTALRGVPGEVLDAISEKQVRSLIAKCLFADFGPGAAPPLAGLSCLKEAGAGRAGESALIWFVTDENRFGVIGLANRIMGELTAKEREFLLTLTGYFNVYLHNAMLFEDSRRLNQELSRSNDRLHRSLGEVERCKVEIDGLTSAKERIKAVISRELARTGLISWLDFLIFVGVSLAVGLLFNYANPKGVPVVPPAWFRPETAEVDVRTAAALFESGQAVFVDARPKDVFERDHIQGAINVPPGFFSFVYGMKLSKTPPDKRIIVYGRTVSSRYDDDLAAEFAKKGRATTAVFPGALDAWKELGLPTSGKGEAK
jgi:rhodanese-related sulfurtransferase